MNELKKRMLERMKSRSVTPLPEDLKELNITRSVSTAIIKKSADFISKTIIEEKILNNDEDELVEELEIKKASSSLSKMKGRMMRKKKVIEITDDDEDNESIAQSEFSIATNVVVERGLGRLLDE